MIYPCHWFSEQVGLAGDLGSTNGILIPLEMDDPDITMEEYIQRETEKALRRGQVFNWETVTYGKIRYDEDVHDLRSVETEFPGIVYNDALTSELALSCEPTIFNVDDLKLDIGNGDDKIDIKQSSGDLPIEPLPNVINIDVGAYAQGSNKLLETSHDTSNMTPPLRDHRYLWLRYEGQEYTNADIVDFKGRLEKIYDRQVMFTSYAWRQLFEIRGPLVHELILEFFSTFRIAEGSLLGESAREIIDKGDLSAYWTEISSDWDFLGTVPSYTLIKDPLMRLCHRLITFSIAGRSQAPKNVTSTNLFYLRSMDVGSVNIPYMLAQYLRRYAFGRKRGARMSGGQFVPPAAGAAQAHQEIPEEGVQANLTLIEAAQIPQAAALAPRTMPQRMARLEKEVHGLREILGEQRAVLDGMSRDFSRFTMWTVGHLSQLLDVRGVTYMRYGDYQIPYQRRTR
ncbi:hypothetical protein Tco_1138883 [Tanacetum coccineum]